jgi:hypothetical protein
LLPLVLAGVWSCRAEAPGSLHSRLTLQPHDTLRFTAVAQARPCGGGRGFVLEGADGGNGVLLWLRSADSVGGEYPVLARGDTITPRGIAGGVRYMFKTADRGVTLDSGAVTVSSAGGRIDAHALGSGLDPNSGQRVLIDASFQAVPLGADTVNCRVQVPS